MSRARLKRIATALAMLGSIPLLTGCGGSNPTNTPVGGIGSGLGVGGCLSVATPLGFAVANGQLLNNKVLAGLIPPTYGGGQAYGTVTLNGSAPTLGQGYQGSGSDGSISLTIQPGSQPGVPNGGYTGGSYGGGALPNGPFSGSGQLTISQIAQQDIAYKIQTGQIPLSGVNPTQPGAFPQPTTPGATGVCVSGIAVSLNIPLYQQRLYLGEVFLYLNNTQHGYVLYF